MILTDNDFNNTILLSNKLILVDCYADWCGPCKEMEPIISEIEKEFGSQIRVAKLDVDKNPETSIKYRILNMPTILFFSSGQLVNMHVGVISKMELIDLINQYI